MHQAGRRLGGSCDWTSSQIRSGGIGNLAGYPIPACHVGSRRVQCPKTTEHVEDTSNFWLEVQTQSRVPRDPRSLFSGLGTRDQKIFPPAVMASLMGNTSPQLSPKVPRSWNLTTRHIMEASLGMLNQECRVVHAEVHRYLTRSQHVLYKYLLGVACRAWSYGCCTMLQMSECRRIVHCAASLSSTGEKHRV
jgi:hypothetical protein